LTEAIFADFFWVGGDKRMEAVIIFICAFLRHIMKKKLKC